MHLTKLLLILGTISLLIIYGCRDRSGSMFNRTLYAQMGWKAERFFDDPKVIELCHAIEANDIDKVDRLIKESVNVNALGRGNMTPLFWAYPGDHLQIFERLLKHGARSKRYHDKGFMGDGGESKNWVKIDTAVTHYACITSRHGYFEAVFDHGGNPNLVAFKGGGARPTPLFMVINSDVGDKVNKVRRLIDLGADINLCHPRWRDASADFCGCSSIGA